MAMKRLLSTITTGLVVISILFANPYLVLADEGEDGVHGLVVEVNGYHVTLSNESEWAKGENTIIVTLADEMGMPVTETDVQMLIAPKAAGHAEAEEQGHSELEADDHSAEPQGHDSMPGMDMGEPAEETAAHEEPAHGEEEHSDLIAMRAADEHGMYVAETHLEKSGVHEILVMFHADGEMIEAGFTVEIPGTNAKTVILWSFVMINMALIASAGFIKKQSLLIKGAK
jgi:hypothetical protein